MFELLALLSILSGSLKVVVYTVLNVLAILSTAAMVHQEQSVIICFFTAEGQKTVNMDIHLQFLLRLKVQYGDLTFYYTPETKIANKQ